MRTPLFCIVALAAMAFSCSSPKQEVSTSDTTKVAQPTEQEILSSYVSEKIKIYQKVKLTTDTTLLADDEKKMLPLLIKAADIMNGLFWQQAYGNKAELMSKITDEQTRKFAEMNYGPWDRLNNNKPFVLGVGEKPAGANFYPADLTKEAYEASGIDKENPLYTIVRKNAEGKLEAIPYNVAFKAELEEAAGYLKQAAALAKDKGLKKYLELRAEALVTNQYKKSDEAWMDMKTNGIDIIIGPIEQYEDGLMGKKTAFSSYVLVRDKEWTKKLSRYTALLPELQKGLPVADAYKKEKPSLNSDLNASDVVYYAGDCNSASKTIAVNLPNDEDLQLKKGTRRTQFKNAIKAKFDNILMPIAKALIVEEQQKNITFDAFFANTMFHEVAHGLGIKNTINGKGKVSEVLGAQGSALEEGKADILGLYMITKLYEKGELKEGVVEDNYVTFLAGIFRSVRFGAASAHGKANMIRFNFFEDKGAFSKDATTGRYKVNFDKMQAAINELSAIILTLQGDGNVEGVSKLMEEKGMIKPALQAELDKLKELGIPVDIEFEQGIEALGL